GLLLLGLRRSFRADADPAGGDHQLAVLVAVLGDRLGEHELPGPTAFLLPRLARLGCGRQNLARLQRPVVLVVLLGVQAAPAATSTTATAAGGRLPLDPGRLLARAEPRLADLGPEEVVGVELGAGLHKGRWG